MIVIFTLKICFLPFNYDGVLSRACNPTHKDLHSDNTGHASVGIHKVL